MENLIGARFGQYEIVALIGAGGMGTVYRARDTRLGREVAVKVLPPRLAQDAEFLQRFQREASTVASLDHPHIIAILNVGEQDGLYYIVMRLAQGETLHDLIRRSGALPVEQALKIIEQLADALQYAHQRSIIHRDLKPANIMVEPHERVTLMDFGIAKPLASKLTRAGTLIGTPEYMAPEQFTPAPVDARADLYALGVVLYEMLTGQVPFKGDTPFSVSQQHTHAPPAPPRQINPRIPPAVEQVILHSLSKRPEERYQTALELATALRAAVSGDRPPAPERPGLKLVLAGGYEHPLRPGVLRLGRASENDLPLDDVQVSRRHAEIHTQAQGSAIVDLGSTNGTYLNGQRLVPHTPYALQAGCQLYLGRNVAVSVQWGQVSRVAPPSFGPGLRTKPPTPSMPIQTTQDAGMPPPAPPRSAGRAPRLPARPTTLLVQAAAGFSAAQLAVGLGLLLLLSVVGVWVGAPTLRRQTLLWNNLPLVAVVGPLAYAAARRRGAALLAHASSAILGGAVLWQRVSYASENYALLLAGALLSGVFMELWLTPLMRRDRQGPSWVVEVVWLALMACLGVAILYGLTVGVDELQRVGQWLGAALLGGLGWFLGDLIYQSIALRRAVH